MTTLGSGRVLVRKVITRVVSLTESSPKKHQKSRISIGNSFLCDQSGKYLAVFDKIGSALPETLFVITTLGFKCVLARKVSFSFNSLTKSSPKSIKLA